MLTVIVVGPETRRREPERPVRAGRPAKPFGDWRDVYLAEKGRGREVQPDPEDRLRERLRRRA